MSEVNYQQPINQATTLLEHYAQGQRSFVNAELGKANLQDVDLKGADLSYADLSRANLRGANLRGTDLSYCDLSHANLTDADLRGALLLSTDLRHAHLQGAKLENADCDRNTHFPPNFDPIQAGVKIKSE